MIALAFFCSFAKGDEALANTKNVARLFILSTRSLKVQLIIAPAGTAHIIT